MKRKFTDWLAKARHLEAAIGAGVEGAAHSLSASRRQPLEVIHAVVDSIASELQPSGRGQVAFPFTHVRVLLRAATQKERAKLEVACDGPPSLDSRVAERLTAARCTSPAPDVKVTFVASARPEWTDRDFHLELSRNPAAPATPPAPPPPATATRPVLHLAIERGTAEHPSYAFDDGVVTIGRGSEVRQRDGRLIRTNLVAFLEGAGDVNGSVSRRHARIEVDRTMGGFRVFDDTDSERTSVVRHGKGLAVPHGRGLRLRSGDRIGIGDARLRVTFG